MNIDQGVEIHHAGDLPARSGIGSSSAFTVGLLHALHVLKGEKIDKYELALEAIYVEHDLIKEASGSQDQIAVSMGGFNYIRFGNHKPIVNQVNVDEKRVKMLEDCLLLVFTGFQHMTNQVASTYDFTKKVELKEIAELTKDAYHILMYGDVRDFGKLFSEQWKLKKSLSPKISTPYVDYLYGEAIRQGILGGRVIGSGNGGFLLMLCEPDRQLVLRNNEAFRDLVFVPVKFEFEGTHNEVLG